MGSSGCRSTRGEARSLNRRRMTKGEADSAWRGRGGGDQKGSEPQRILKIESTGGADGVR